jgi:hypothetical protein
MTATDAALAHPELAESAAQRYEAHLRQITAAGPDDLPTQKPLRDLIETLEAAQRLGPRLDPRDVKFTVRSLAGPELAGEDLKPFLNEFQLGLGADGASIVAMGTEAADDPRDPEDLAWGCLQTALILSGSPQRVVEALLRSSQRWWAELEDGGLPRAPWRPFHVHPNDLYQVQRRSHTHTWVNLAKLVHPAEARWEDLLDRDAEPGLGGLVYQI